MSYSFFSEPKPDTNRAYLIILSEIRCSKLVSFFTSNHYFFASLDVQFFFQIQLVPHVPLTENVQQIENSSVISDCYTHACFINRFFCGIKLAVSSTEMQISYKTPPIQTSNTDNNSQTTSLRSRRGGSMVYSCWVTRDHWSSVT